MKKTILGMALMAAAIVPQTASADKGNVHFKG